MNKDVLKTTITQLKTLRPDIKTDINIKTDDEETLKSKANALMTALMPEQVKKVHDSIEPRKVLNVLNRDCFGLMLDLSHADCLACVDQTSCMKAFLDNLKNDFSLFSKAMNVITLEEEASAVTEEDVPVAKPGKKSSLKRAPIAYDAKRPVFVVELPVDNDKDSDEYKYLMDILKVLPDTLGALFKITKKHFDLFTTDEGTEHTKEEAGAVFMKNYVSFLRKSGFVKLSDDLTDEDKAQLTAAKIKF